MSVIARVEAEEPGSTTPTRFHLVRLQHELTKGEHLPGSRTGEEHSALACICVIAEERSLTALLTDLLEPEHEVVVGWGENGYKTLAETTCDLVLLDLAWRRPERGWDILTFMRLHPYLRHLPIIVCMAPSDEALAKADWFKERSIFLLEKPFEMDTLEAAVEHAYGLTADAG